MSTTPTQQADPVSDTIETIIQMHGASERRVGRHQRFVETGTAFIGRPFVLYCLFGFDIAWVTLNLWLYWTGRHPFDPPPFYWLQGLTTLGASYVAMIVLITQNRQGRLAQHRGQLDLQINLLNEQKSTKIIALLEELRRDLPIVHNRHDPEAEKLSETTDPRQIAEALEFRMENDVLDEEQNA